MGMIGGGPEQKRYHTPGVRDLAWWERVGFIERPDELVRSAVGLLESEHWEDMVVGLGLLTGRCLVEVLKTGVLVPKTRYALWYTTYQEQVDAVWGPFEIPTLIEAERVFVAWRRVRTLFLESEGEGGKLSARDLCARYRSRVCASAKGHFRRRVPVDEHHDWYAPLYERLYPLIAVRYYCPNWINATWFGESIRGFEWPITYEGIDVGAQKPQCEHCVKACCVYAVGDEVDNIDGGQGLKLDLEGVEVLECIRVPKKLDEQHPRVKAWREWVAQEEAEW